MLRTIEVTWIIDLFNKIWRTNKMPNDGRSTLVPIYKNKRDSRSLQLSRNKIFESKL